jgi:hypothetical protein
MRLHGWLLCIVSLSQSSAALSGPVGTRFDVDPKHTDWSSVRFEVAVTDLEAIRQFPKDHMSRIEITVHPTHGEKPRRLCQLEVKEGGRRLVSCPLEDSGKQSVMQYAFVIATGAVAESQVVFYRYPKPSPNPDFEWYVIDLGTFRDPK